MMRSLLFCLLLTHQVVAQWTPPAWWDLISSTFEGNLKRCFKRQVSPVNGTSCSRTDKTCFFGDKECDGIGPYPEVQCDCKDRVWNCDEDIDCPDPEPTVQGSCPYVNTNSPDCPDTNPLFSGEICASASLIGATCRYGEESCCGECFANFFCSCFAVGEQFGCGNTDACFGAQCQRAEQEAAWALLVGTTMCDPDAINAILADYPFMTVLCIAEGSPVTADFRNDRVRLFFDPATGLVSVPPTVG